MMGNFILHASLVILIDYQKSGLLLMFPCPCTIMRAGLVSFLSQHITGNRLSCGLSKLSNLLHRDVCCLNLNLLLSSKVQAHLLRLQHFQRLLILFFCWIHIIRLIFWQNIIRNVRYDMSIRCCMVGVSMPNLLLLWQSLHCHIE